MTTQELTKHRRDLRFARRIWRTDAAWRPKSVGASVRVGASHQALIGFGDDGQDALEEAVRTLGGWSRVVEIHYRGRTVGMRRRPMSAAISWVRGIDRERLLARAGLAGALESLARLLVRDALQAKART